MSRICTTCQHDREEHHMGYKGCLLCGCHRFNQVPRTIEDVIAYSDYLASLIGLEGIDRPYTFVEWFTRRPDEDVR